MAAKDLDQLVQTNPEANGLAIVISNDYKEIKEVESLTGTTVDAKHMIDTFTVLKFATYHQQNIRRDRLIEVVHTAASYQEYPDSYRRIAVVFSGHGTNEQLFTQEGARVDINDILRPFHPERAPFLGKIPKLFFIDACRGEKSNPGVYVPRGGELVSTLHVPEQGNFLIAYSTMPEYRSYEVKGQGGIWITALAKKLKEENASILDILTRVNEKMVEEFQRPGRAKSMQQPELLSRLNEEVNLFKEARGFESGECSDGRDTTNGDTTHPLDECLLIATQARQYDIQPLLHAWPPHGQRSLPPYLDGSQLQRGNSVTDTTMKASRKKPRPRQPKRKSAQTPKDQDLDSSPNEKASLPHTATEAKKEASTPGARRISAKKRASMGSIKATGQVSYMQDSETGAQTTLEPEQSVRMKVVNESSNPTSQTSPAQLQTEDETTVSAASVHVNSEENGAENSSSTSGTVSQEIGYKRVLSAPAQLEIDYPKLAMYTTDPVKKLYHYCMENGKPEPTYYKPSETSDGLYIVTVYVAKTCGRTKGDAKPTVSEAKENAAAKLLLKLHIY